MNTSNKTIVKNFIEDIWNKSQFDKMDNYIASDFIDYSLPQALPANMIGTKRWIIGTGKSFEHKTLIEDIVSEDNKVVLKIKMKMKHIGVWRDIEPTFAEVEATGYRLFKLANNKIIAHWALIDGTAIESKLRETAKSCKI